MLTSTATPMTPSAADVDAVFGALADATRRDILRRAMGGDLGVSDLAEPYPVSFAAVQKHVAVLERAGLVTKRRVGRRALVTTDVDGLRAAQALLDQYEQLWRHRLQRMGDILDEPEPTDPKPDPSPPEGRTT